MEASERVSGTNENNSYIGEFGGNFRPFGIPNSVVVEILIPQ
jgi:hypothetical protein